MKVIIDIPEKDYNNIEPFLNGKTIEGGFNLFKVLEIIKNGTPFACVKEDNKLIRDARCCICGGVKRFGICQDCGSDM